MTVNNKKGALLFIVLAVVMIVVILAGVILSIISSQSRLTHHQVSRIKAYYAGKGMMNYTLEKLRTGDWDLPPAVPGTPYYACHKAVGSTKDCVDSVTRTYEINQDSDIPYNVQVAIFPDGTGPNNTTARLEIKTEYTYTP